MGVIPVGMTGLAESEKAESVKEGDMHFRSLIRRFHQGASDSYWPDWFERAERKCLKSNPYDKCPDCR